MGLDCIMTVPAGSGNGAPSKPMVDHVSRFIRDSDYYYRAVFKHIEGCTLCDPEEAILGYLENRNKRMFGRTSGGLVHLSHRYRRKFPDRIGPEIPALFLERSLASDWDGYMNHASKDKLIGLLEVRRAVEFEEKAWRKEVLSALPKLRKAAISFVKREVERKNLPIPKESPQPFYNLCFQLFRDDDRHRDAGNAELYDGAKKLILAFCERDFEKDEDPDVRKAVKIIRILRGSHRAGTVLPPPSVDKRDDRDYLLTESGYVNDDDTDVSSLAQSIIVMSVMNG